MTRSRAALFAGLALACVAELAFFISLLRAPEPSASNAVVPLAQSLDDGEELVYAVAPEKEAFAAPVVAPGPAFRLVTARVSVSPGGDIDVVIKPADWVAQCPSFAPSDALQARAQVSLAEDSGPLVVQRTACMTVQPGQEGEFRAVPDTSRLLATDEPFEGSVQAQAWQFADASGRARQVRVAGLFWCPEELEDSDTCFAAVSLELGEPGSPLLVPVRLPSRGSSAVALSPR